MDKNQTTTYKCLGCDTACLLNVKTTNYDDTPRWCVYENWLNTKGEIDEVKWEQIDNPKQKCVCKDGGG